MESALIVSSSQESIVFFKDMLSAACCYDIVIAGNAKEAQDIFVLRDFDLCIINCPLPGGYGENLAVEFASSGAQVILVVKASLYEDISLKMEDAGVITVSKPVNRNIFWNAVKIVKAAQKKIQVIQKENTKLQEQIEDIKIIDRAKYILISYLNMTEPEAHKYMEKQAMDMMITKRKVAEGILKTYEN